MATSSRPPDSSGTLWRAYHAWRGAAGPLADFVAAAPFLAPWEPEPREPRHPRAGRLARRLLARLEGDRSAAGDSTRWPPEGTAAGQPAVFLETAPRLGLAAGIRLGAAGWTVVPLFARWPAAGAVLPAERLAAWLPAVVRRLRERASPPAPPGNDAGRPAGPTPLRLCLLLDAERARPVGPRALRRRFDNRYEYGAYTLPPGARLRQWGVARVLWAGPAATVPADLEAYTDDLIAAGITLELVRLGALW